MNSKLPLNPGYILKNEFMIPLRITGTDLSRNIGLPAISISHIIHNKKRLTPDVAIRLSKFFGNSTEFWLNLQTIYDIKISLQKNKTAYNKIKPFHYPPPKSFRGGQQLHSPTHHGTLAE